LRQKRHSPSRKTEDEGKHLADDDQKVVPEIVRGQNTFVIRIDKSFDLASELEKGVLC